jgi:hypothetical protein
MGLERIAGPLCGRCSLATTPAAAVGDPVARPGTARRGRLEPLEVAGGQHYVGRDGVLFEALDPLRARDRDDVRALREQPGQRQLSGRDATFVRQALQLADEHLVAPAGFAVEAGSRRLLSTPASRRSLWPPP